MVDIDCNYEADRSIIWKNRPINEVYRPII